MKRIVICYRANKKLGELQAKFPQVEIAITSTLSEAVELAKSASAFVCSGRDMSTSVANTLFTYPDIKWIQLTSAGVDSLSAVKVPAHVAVTRGGGLYEASVSEQALALVFALYRQIHISVRHQAAGAWIVPDGSFETVSGKRALVLGLGEIGRGLAKRLSHLGAHVTGLSRNPPPIEGIAVRRIADLPELLGETDILACVLPGGPETKGLIDADALDGLPSKAIVVNVGRGNAIVGTALLEALTSGRIRGAGLDVTDPEPLPPEHPLWQCPNLIVTPHVGGRDSQQQDRVAALIEGNLSRFLAGEPLLHRVV